MLTFLIAFLIGVIGLFVVIIFNLEPPSPLFAGWLAALALGGWHSDDIAKWLTKLMKRKK